MTPPDSTAPSTGALPVGALLFDVFGTVVDWRGSLLRSGARWSAERGRSVDWPALADAWRGGYQPAMEAVRSGARPWTPLDALHREILDEIAPRYGLGDLGEEERDELVRWWHRLEPWPDAVGGLQRLRARFTVASLSNGNVALLTAMAKRAALPWDCVLSAELARQYKPRPEVYLHAAELLALPPARIAMVAAHADDLEAARAVGMRTVYLHRPREFGPQREVPRPAADAFDLAGDDLHEIADRLGCR